MRHMRIKGLAKVHHVVNLQYMATVVVFTASFEGIYNYFLMLK